MINRSQTHNPDGAALTSNQPARPHPRSGCSYGQPQRLPVPRSNGCSAHALADLRNGCKPQTVLQSSVGPRWLLGAVRRSPASHLCTVLAAVRHLWQVLEGEGACPIPAPSLRGQLRSPVLQGFWRVQRTCLTKKNNDTHLPRHRSAHASQAQAPLSTAQHQPASPRAPLTCCHRINNPLTSAASTASAALVCRTPASNNQEGAISYPQPPGRPSTDAHAQRPLAAPTTRLQVSSGVSTPGTTPAPCRESLGGHGGIASAQRLGMPPTHATPNCSIGPRT